VTPRQRGRSRGTPGLRQGGHGLTAAEIEAMLERQGRVCLICGLDRGTGWVIDHDHELARLHPHAVNVGCRACVRGVLCRNCNTNLGWFEQRAARILAYIELGKRRPS